MASRSACAGQRARLVTDELRSGSWRLNSFSRPPQQLAAVDIQLLEVSATLMFGQQEPLVLESMLEADFLPRLHRAIEALRLQCQPLTGNDSAVVTTTVAAPPAASNQVDGTNVARRSTISFPLSLGTSVACLERLQLYFCLLVGLRADDMSEAVLNMFFDACATIVRLIDEDWSG